MISGSHCAKHPEPSSSLVLCSKSLSCCIAGLRVSIARRPGCVRWQWRMRGGLHSSVEDEAQLVCWPSRLHYVAELPGLVMLARTSAGLADTAACCVTLREYMLWPRTRQAKCERTGRGHMRFAGRARAVTAILSKECGRGACVCDGTIPVQRSIPYRNPCGRILLLQSCSCTAMKLSAATACPALWDAASNACIASVMLGTAEVSVSWE